MPWRARSYWIAAAAVAYTAFAALRASAGGGPAWLALAGLPFVLALGWRLTAPPARGEDRIDPAARSAARAALAGAALLAAARTGPSSPALIALGNLGAAIASLSALVALSRMSGLGGLLETPARRLNDDAAAFASLFWTVAVALPAASVIAPQRAADLDPRATAYATSTAALGSLAVSVIALGRARAARRLELGVADRAEAGLLLTTTSLAIGVLAALVGVARPEALLPVAAAAAAVCVAWSAVSSDAAALSRALRVTLALAALATPMALLAVYAVHASPVRLDAAERTLLGLPRSPVGAAVFVACAACAAAGFFAPRLARRLAPEGARWLRALDAATRAAMHPDPEAALESALLSLREVAHVGRDSAFAGPSGGAARFLPALYRLAPPERVTVDLAGYAHTEHAEIPPRLVALCDDEPEGILRIEVLEAAQVRRPEVRPLLAWLSERGIGAVAVVRDAAGPAGALTLPRGERASPMSLEVVLGLRALADRLGAVISVSGMLARARRRELDARCALAEQKGDADRLARALARGQGRLRAMAERLARPARVAAYSPAARAAVDQIARLGAGGRPVTLLAAPGIDAVAWAALAHLASPRAGGAITLVDGASAAEHALARWRDADASPIETARGGTLVVLDAQALPSDVQSYLAAALPDDAGLVVTVPQTVDALVAIGQLSERLADRLGDRAVALPALAARGEDLRALALDHLARIGTRLRGRPLGLDLAALSAILEYAWPGNDAELGAVLLRAAIATEGDVVGARELEAIGFRAPAAGQTFGAAAEMLSGRRRRATKR
jgi:hypothetical protein